MIARRGIRNKRREKGGFTLIARASLREINLAQEGEEREAIRPGIIASKTSWIVGGGREKSATKIHSTLSLRRLN